MNDTARLWFSVCWVHSVIDNLFLPFFLGCIPGSYKQEVAQPVHHTKDKLFSFLCHSSEWFMYACLLTVHQCYEVYLNTYSTNACTFVQTRNGSCIQGGDQDPIYKIGEGSLSTHICARARKQISGGSQHTTFAPFLCHSQHAALQPCMCATITC